MDNYLLLLPSQSTNSTYFIQTTEALNFLQCLDISSILILSETKAYFVAFDIGIILNKLFSLGK